ncbi:hypothetical protein ALC56_07002 [Trachymyrmex septentrionalis]|uniref:Uncharacterized protein n=1 Tax=Trachymyrmex septentrionalis TaxID=34720 RepID=A0A151JWJ3_9HYME|nr:hypothetical protein ALC56_07002 [Trachymyrmex septentrionalis]
MLITVIIFIALLRLNPFIDSRVLRVGDRSKEASLPKCIVVFICLATKAAYLELTTSLSSEAFLNVFLSRMLITTVNCLRSNHFNLNHSLFRKNLIDDPSCPCGASCQDLVHIIFDCLILECHALLLRTALQDSSLDNPLNPNDSIIHASRNSSAKIC